MYSLLYRGCLAAASHLCLASAGEEKLGCDIVAKALRAPVRLIASNAGVEGDVIIEKLLGKDFEIGYNAVRDIPSCSHSACSLAASSFRELTYMALPGNN